MAGPLNDRPPLSSFALAALRLTPSTPDHPGAAISGASVRLRAELLSALIGSISLIPFIISSGTGAEIEKPLAIVVVGGLVTRPIKIVILPMVYEWVERRAQRAEEEPALEVEV